MSSTRDLLEVLVDERGCGEVPFTVEREQSHQDSQVVNRQGHEPHPGSREPSAEQDRISANAIVRLMTSVSPLEMGPGLVLCALAPITVAEKGS